MANHTLTHLLVEYTIIVVFARVLIGHHSCDLELVPTAATACQHFHTYHTCRSLCGL